MTGYVATVWAALCGVLALVWTVTGRGYPYGPDHTEDLAVIHLLPPAVGAPLFAAVFLAAAVLAFAMSGPHAVRRRRVLLVLGWTLSFVLVAVVPGAAPLAITGYAPMLILGLPFGLARDVDYGQVFGWTLQNEVFSLVAGVLLAATVFKWQRSSLRFDPVRLGRWAVGVALAVPLVYALTRYAWLLGISLGMSRTTLRELHDSGAVWAGAGLATFAVVGSLLTLGLVQRWGETFPRWIPWLGGRRVPVKLAVIPATYVAVVVLAASVGMLANPRVLAKFGTDFWAIGPMVLWPVWAVALGAATYAYAVRRANTRAVGTG
jgi:hypothetical protein